MSPSKEVARGGPGWNGRIHFTLAVDFRGGPPAGPREARADVAAGVRGQKTGR